MELDGLYRGLHGSSPNPFSVVTWEFPVLAKYRFSVPLAKPFVEGGPAFRTAANLNWASPSRHGVTAGAGVAIDFGHFEFAPELRYTRWAADNNPGGTNTKPDQLELLFGFSANSGSDRRPFGKFMTVGAVLGTNLTDDVRSAAGPVILQFGLPNGTVVSVNGTSSIKPGGRSFLAGPSLEIETFHNLSIEADAVYRPLRSVQLFEFPNGSIFSRDAKSFVTWQFPVLAKYRFKLPFEKQLKPFVEAGPAFRLRQQASEVSPYGVTAGVGVEAHFHVFRISPEFRYSHWGANQLQGGSEFHSNEVQFLANLSF